MFFSQALYSLWSSLELFMAISHLFVFIGKSNETRSWSLLTKSGHMLLALIFQVCAIRNWVSYAVNTITSYWMASLIWLIYFLIHHRLSVCLSIVSGSLLLSFTCITIGIWRPILHRNRPETGKFPKIINTKYPGSFIGLALSTVPIVSVSWNRVEKY